jgi:hypothetical protein
VSDDPLAQFRWRACIFSLAAIFRAHRVQKLDPPRIVQLAEPATAVLTAILSECAGRLNRFDSC